MTPRVGDANWANQAIWTGDTSARLWGLPDLVDMVDHADADEGVEHRATRRTFHPSPAPQTGVSTNSTTPEVSYPKSTAGHLDLPDGTDNEPIIVCTMGLREPQPS